MGGHWLHVEAVGPACKVCEQIIPEEVQAWEGNLGSHVTRSPGERSLLFLTLIVSLLWNNLGTSVKLDVSAAGLVGAGSSAG